MGAVKCLLRGGDFLIARVKALRDAVRVGNVRLSHRLRMKLVPYLRRLETPARDDVLRLFEASGLWVRNIGDRRHVKRTIQKICRRIIDRLSRRRTDRWQSATALPATGISAAARP